MHESGRHPRVCGKLNDGMSSPLTVEFKDSPDASIRRCCIASDCAAVGFLLDALR